MCGSCDNNEMCGINELFGNQLTSGIFSYIIHKDKV